VSAKTESASATHTTYLIREIEKGCSAPVVDSATTDYEITMGHYKFYKKGGVGGHLYSLQPSKRAMKARITTALLQLMLGF